MRAALCVIKQILRSLDFLLFKLKDRKFTAFSKEKKLMHSLCPSLLIDTLSNQINTMLKDSLSPQCCHSDTTISTLNSSSFSMRVFVK